MSTTRRLRRATLEVTLKPFELGRADAEVAREVFEQWDGLLNRAEGVSILLWVGDGSEILEWADDVEQMTEWARFVGFSNPEQFGIAPGDPQAARPYSPGTGPIAYRRIRDVAAALRREALRSFEDVRIGTAFDPGPEFVPSGFKFERHPEISVSPLDLGEAPVRSHYHVTCSWSVLAGDDHRYAAFPTGIPDGISLGSFLGAQAQTYLTAMGFDYLWLSNGFGFSFHPWSYRGINFDGVSFGKVDAAEAAAFSLSFWEDFARECVFPLEARGTNFPVGVELAKDLTPLRELYRRGFLAWPAPNSPWGALNRNFGVEIAGALSRAAYTPTGVFPFRFYANDPWFWQNPWRDCYGREPYDIYMPLSVAAIRQEGVTETAGIIEVLSVDTEYGVLDGQVAREIVPHLNRALDIAPDEPGLITWVYPFDGMFDLVEADPAQASAAFFQDWFVAECFTHGMPVNTVVGALDLARILESDPARFDCTVLLACASLLDDPTARALAEHVRRGGRALFYGAPRSTVLLDLLGLDRGAPLSGDAVLRMSTRAPSALGLVRVTEANAAGGSGEQATGESVILAEVDFAEGTRVFAVTRADGAWSGGRASWIRGSLPFDERGTAELPTRLSPDYVDAAALAVELLADLGIDVRHRPRPVTFHEATIYEERAKSAQFTAFRSDNALWFAGYEQDTTATVSIGLPEGAPVAVGQTVMIQDGIAAYELGSSFLRETRVYVRQPRGGVVACKEGHPLPTERNAHVKRVLSVSPLVAARVEVHPPADAIGDVEVRLNGASLDPARVDRSARGLVVLDVTGTIEFVW